MKSKRSDIHIYVDTKFKEAFKKLAESKGLKVGTYAKLILHETLEKSKKDT